MNAAKERLATERKQWRKDRPAGFVAKPRTKEDGTQDLFLWECKIPGAADTIWEEGLFAMQMIFDEDYPIKPPKCVFTPPLPHPNIYPSGTVCLSILNEAHWKPTLNIPQVLRGIQDLLDQPNSDDPAQKQPYDDYKNNRALYNRKVRAFAAAHAPE